MATHIRKNDIVEVIAGDHKGARGKVLHVDRDRKRVVVEGVNVVFRHVRPTRRNPQGGRVQKEAAIHLSNVLPFDSATGRGQRVRFETTTAPSGAVANKKRMTVKGSTLNTLTRPERTRASK